jgi:hypothetical protein
MDVKCDDVCKDISRLSFAPMQKEILYYNPSLLFAPLPEAGDYPDDKAPLFSGVAGVGSEGEFSGVKEKFLGSSGVQEYRSSDNSSDWCFQCVSSQRSKHSSELLSEAKTPSLLNSQNKAADGLSSSLLSEAETPKLPK